MSPKTLPAILKVILFSSIFPAMVPKALNVSSSQTPSNLPPFAESRAFILTLLELLLQFICRRSWLEEPEYLALQVNLSLAPSLSNMVPDPPQLPLNTANGSLSAATAGQLKTVRSNKETHMPNIFILKIRILPADFMAVSFPKFEITNLIIRLACRKLCLLMMTNEQNLFTLSKHPNTQVVLQPRYMIPDDITLLISVLSVSAFDFDQLTSKELKNRISKIDT
jgi:hypothetical protein